jgi:hypothetical protein
MHKIWNKNRLGPRVLTMGFALLFLTALIVSCGSKETGTSEQEHNTLTKKESDEGWTLLFDGKTFAGWRGLGREDIPEGHWVIEDGAIKKVPTQEVPRQEDGQPVKGGDLITVRTFENFELYLEWKISLAGNSGIKYNVSEEMSTSHPPDRAALGFEYQILDDEEHPDAKAGAHRTAGALYDLIAPAGKTLKPVGEYNAARIVFNGNHGEHWLNGIKVLEYDLDTPEMESRLAASKYRIYARFAEKRKGHIVLQDHGNVVWYRNIKMREIKPNEVLN